MINLNTRQKALAISTSVLLFASLLALVPTSSVGAAPYAPSNPPKTVDVTKYSSSSGRSADWTKDKPCFFCKTFWKNRSSSSRLTFWMGDLQGTFRLSYEAPNRRNVNGGFRVKIYEKRVGESRYHHVRTLSTSRIWNKGNWWTWHARIEIDGRVKVVAEPTSSNKIALRRFRMKHVEQLPEHRKIAEAMCRAGVFEKQDLTGPEAMGAALKPVLNDSIREIAETYIADGRNFRSFLRALARNSATYIKQFLKTGAAVLAQIGASWLLTTLVDAIWPSWRLQIVEETFADKCRYWYNRNSRGEITERRHDTICGFGGCYMDGRPRYSDDIAKLTHKRTGLSEDIDPHGYSVLQRRSPRT